MDIKSNFKNFLKLIFLKNIVPDMKYKITITFITVYRLYIGLLRSAAFVLNIFRYWKYLMKCNERSFHTLCIVTSAI
jgi:hypothetical protein